MSLRDVDDLHNERVINGERHYLRCAVDHKGGVLEAFVTNRRGRRAALKELGDGDLQSSERWLNNRVEN